MSHLVLAQTCDNTNGFMNEVVGMGKRNLLSFYWISEKASDGAEQQNRHFIISTDRHWMDADHANTEFIFI